MDKPLLHGRGIAGERACTDGCFIDGASCSFKKLYVVACFLGAAMLGCVAFALAKPR